jgi:hypothetical protein
MKYQTEFCAIGSLPGDKYCDFRRPIKTEVNDEPQYLELKIGDLLQKGDEMTVLDPYLAGWMVVNYPDKLPRIGDHFCDFQRKFRRPVKKLDEPATLTETDVLRMEIQELKTKLRETEVAVSVYGRLQKLLKTENKVVAEVQLLLAEEALLDVIMGQI